MSEPRTTEILEESREKQTQSLAYLDYVDKQIHNGNGFYYSGSTTLNNTDTIDFGIQTSQGHVFSRIIWGVFTGNSFSFNVYERADITFDGTDLTISNSNRNSFGVSGWVEFQSDPTVNDVGNEIFAISVGSGAEKKDARKLILKSNTVYLFRITSLADSNLISYVADWDEYEDKS